MAERGSWTWRWMWVGHWRAAARAALEKSFTPPPKPQAETSKQEVAGDHHLEGGGCAWPPAPPALTEPFSWTCPQLDRGPSPIPGLAFLGLPVSRVSP